MGISASKCQARNKAGAHPKRIQQNQGGSFLSLKNKTKCYKVDASEQKTYF